MKKLFQRFSQPKIAIPIPDPDFPALIAQDIDGEDQHELFRIFPEIASTARWLGKTDFSLYHAKDYHQSLPTSRTIVWFLLLIICAAVNLQAVRSCVDNNIPAEWYRLKPFISFALAVGFMGLIEWILTSELKTYLAKEDVRRIKHNLGKQSGEGDIAREVEKGQWQAYQQVQQKYSWDEPHVSRLKRWLLGIAYVIEIVASFYNVFAYGESDSPIAYIAPLVGVMFSALSSLYRGIKIEYPRWRHRIGYHYLSVALEQPLESLSASILVANTVTEAFLRSGGNLSRETVEQIVGQAREAEAQIRFDGEIDQIVTEYRQHHQTLRHEEQKALTDLDEQERKRQQQSRSVQSPERQQQHARQVCCRLERQYLEAKLQMVEETQQKVRRLYQRYPGQNPSTNAFFIELTAQQEEYQTHLSQLREEERWHPRSPRSPDSFPSNDDSREKPFDADAT
jgi:hypothetical protein